MVEIENLSVGYGKDVVISGITLNFLAGKIYTLIGPNGSGKSTVLKTLTKELKSLGGKIWMSEFQSEKIENLEEMNESDASRHISMVMTEKIRPEMMSCREVVATGRYPYTGRLGLLTDEDWKAVDEAIALVHGEDLCEKDFSKVSDGQRQRIMLARAICQDTEIIILDEPTTFLDMYHKLDLLKIIWKLAHAKNKLIIMSLHELDLVKMISDSVICVAEQGISRVGTVNEVFSENYIQQLYGIREDEFNPSTGQMILKI